MFYVVGSVGLLSFVLDFFYLLWKVDYKKVFFILGFVISSLLELGFVHFLSAVLIWVSRLRVLVIWNWQQSYPCRATLSLSLTLSYFDSCFFILNTFR